MADSISKLLSSVALVALTAVVCYNTIKGLPPSSSLNSLVTIAALYSKSPEMRGLIQALGKTPKQEK